MTPLLDVGVAQWVLGRWSPAGMLVRGPVAVLSVAVAVVLVRAAGAGAQAVWSGVGA